MLQRDGKREKLKYFGHLNQAKGFQRRSLNRKLNGKLERGNWRDTWARDIMNWCTIRIMLTLPEWHKTERDEESRNDLLKEMTLLMMMERCIPYSIGRQVLWEQTIVILDSSYLHIRPPKSSTVVLNRKVTN